VAYWGHRFDGLASADAAQNVIRYFSVNLITGAIFASPAPSVPPASATNIASHCPPPRAAKAISSRWNQVLKK
jgi:hypothetical protein